MKEKLIAILLSGAVLLGGCSTQRESYQSPKKQEIGYDEYFIETPVETRERHGKERRIINGLTETGRADKPSAAKIACGAVSKRGEIKKVYYYLPERHADCLYRRSN